MYRFWWLVFMLMHPQPATVPHNGFPPLSEVSCSWPIGKPPGDCPCMSCGPVIMEPICGAQAMEKLSERQ